MRVQTRRQIPAHAPAPDWHAVHSRAACSDQQFCMSPSLLGGDAAVYTHMRRRQTTAQVGTVTYIFAAGAHRAAAGTGKVLCCSLDL